MATGPSSDPDGYWYIQGRSDDTLKVAGKRVGPAEVESAAVAHPAVVEAAAIGIPHAIKGEAIAVFCVLRPGESGGPEVRSAIAAEVVDHASCPVLVARDERLGPVVLADDGSSSAQTAEELLMRWPIFGGLPISVVTVVEGGFPYAERRRPAGLHRSARKLRRERGRGLALDHGRGRGRGRAGPRHGRSRPRRRGAPSWSSSRFPPSLRRPWRSGCPAP